jgi:hypothetical protein
LEPHQNSSVSFRAGFEPRGGVILAVCGNRPTHNAPEKPIPGRAGCLGIAGDWQAFCDKMAALMGATATGTQIQRAIETVEQPGIGIAVIGDDRNTFATLGLLAYCCELVMRECPNRCSQPTLSRFGCSARSPSGLAGILPAQSET